LQVFSTESHRCILHRLLKHRYSKKVESSEQCTHVQCTKAQKKMKQKSQCWSRQMLCKLVCCSTSPAIPTLHGTSDMHCAHSHVLQVTCVSNGTAARHAVQLSWHVGPNCSACSNRPHFLNIRTQRCFCASFLLHASMQQPCQTSCHTACAKCIHHTGSGQLSADQRR
jgi:hypothetical protein